jgi:hypothetical protein
MWFCTHLRQCWKYIKAIDFEYKDEELDAIAPRIYARCVDWFGPPIDPNWPYQIMGGPFGTTTRDFFAKRYIITIPTDCKTLEQRVAVLAHEMYHRVTMHRDGLRRQLWIDEMMAEVTTLKFLREAGFTWYANQWLCSLYDNPPALDMRDLQRGSRHKSGLWNALGIEHHDEFYDKVALIGVELQRLVGWEQICRIVHCRTWDEWLASLSADLRAEVCDLLALTPIFRR